MTQTGEARVVCPAKKDLPIRWFIAAGIFIGFGMWCLHDSRYFANAVPVEEIKKDDGTPDLNKALQYYLNNVGGIVLPILGLIPLACGIHTLRRKLIADDTGVGFAGRQIPWSKITKVDDSQLAERATLKLHYEQDGQQKQLVISQMDLENFKALVEIVQAQTAGR